MDVASPRRSRKCHIPCLSINFSLGRVASFKGANDIRDLMLIVRVFFFPFYSYRYGATGVWVGTRFVASTEAGAPKIHKDLVVSAGFDDTIKTIIYTGRPLHIRKNDYVVNWCVTSSQRRFPRLSSRRVTHLLYFWRSIGRKTERMKSRSLQQRASSHMKLNWRSTLNCRQRLAHVCLVSYMLSNSPFA